MKTILVPIDAFEGQEARMQAAFDRARATSGQIVAVQVTPYAAYAMGDGGMGTFPVTTLIEAIDAERRHLRAETEARLKAEGVAWDWVARDGDMVETLATLVYARASVSLFAEAALPALAIVLVGLVPVLLSTRWSNRRR